MVSQLAPDHLTFRFPDGGEQPGTLSFTTLPPDRRADSPAIPLVSPTTLGYGYTATIQRMDFLVRSKVDTSIVNEPDGVFLVHDSNRKRIAERHVAFFDTGTPLPLVLSNGDVSLLGSDVAAGNIDAAPSGRYYDALRVVFRTASGGQLVMQTADVAPYRTENSSATIPVAAQFPNGMAMLASVIGYPLLTEYDFQIDFDRARATTIHFSQRSEAAAPASTAPSTSP